MNSARRLLLGLAAGSFACLLGTVVAAALEVPFLEGRVNDLADLIPAADEERIEQKLATFERETGTQIAVLVVESLDGDNLEDFSIRVVETWKLGREDADDGVLLLVAREERQLRLEVGYGLEGALPDALARRVVDNIVAPRFREGDFAGGIETGLDAVMQIVRGEAPPPQVTSEPGDSNLGCLGILLVLFLIYIVFTAMWGMRRMRRGAPVRGGWSSRRGGGVPWILTGGGGGWGGGWSGGGGGGFGGFSGGGGSFGGGGASGRW